MNFKGDVSIIRYFLKAIQDLLKSSILIRLICHYQSEVMVEQYFGIGIIITE